MIIYLKPEDPDTYTMAFNPKSEAVDAESLQKLPQMFKFSKAQFIKRVQGNFYKHRPVLMPPAVKYAGNNMRVVVWERPPAFRTVSFTNTPQSNASYDQVDKNLYRVPVPWQVYILYMDAEFQIMNLFMYFRNAPLSAEDEMLSYPYLPNFYDNGRLCQASMQTVVEYPHNIQGAIQAAYNMIWNSGFNTDTLQAFNHMWQLGEGNCAIVDQLKTKGRKDTKDFFKYLVFYGLEDVVSWKYWNYADLSTLINNASFLSNEVSVPEWQSALVSLYFEAQESSV